MRDPCYAPRMLSLITTYRCNATCAHCCFECAPSQSRSMSLSMMEKIISQCDGFTKISFSGGEPFLELDACRQSFAITSDSHRFDTIAAVTNCFWAETREKSLSILRGMQAAGLNLLGISCDQYHQRFIPAGNIVNALLAARELEIPVQINVISPHGEFMKPSIPEPIANLMERIGEHGLRIQCMLDYERVYIGEATGISILQGEVMPAGRAGNLPPDDIGAYELSASWKDACILQKMGKTPSYEAQVLTILPDYRCFPCCSLYSPSGHLTIGNIQEESLSCIIAKANSSPLIEALSLVGIPALKEIVDRHLVQYRGKKFAGVCDFCRSISNDREAAELLG